MKKYLMLFFALHVFLLSGLVNNAFATTEWSPAVSAGVNNWRAIDMSHDGKYQTAGGANTYIYISSDHGKTWSQTSRYGYWTGIAVSETGQYQTAVHFNGYIYISSDYGITWTQKESSRPWQEVDISGTGQYQTAVVYNGSGPIYVSSDYGNTWTPKDSNRYWTGISISYDGKYQTATGLSSAGGSGYAYISSDYGNTWTPKGSLVSVIQGVSISGMGQYQTYVSFPGYIYVSSDYGNTWSQKAFNGQWYSVDVSSTGQYQTAVYYSGPIYISSDYGNTWIPETDSGSRTWFRIAISADAEYQTAVAYGDYIYTLGDVVLADTIAPETTISSVFDGLGVSITNGGTTESKILTIAFSGTDDVSPVSSLTFSCSLDGSTFVSCSNPKTYTDLIVGTHTFSVKATDVAGNVDATPATYSWTITAPVPPADTVAPETTILSSVDSLGVSIENGGTTESTGMTIEFTGTDNIAGNLTFSCILNGIKTNSCVSPITFVDLATGNHVFSVETTDAAGNVDATPATYSWTITDAPVPPPAPITSIEQLMAMVNSMSFPSKITDKLNHNLDLAIKKLNDDKMNNDGKFVCNEISLFIKDLKNAVKKDISQSQADALISATELVQVEFGCIDKVASNQSLLAIIWSAVRPVFAMLGFLN